jgi:hypothetical protein
VRDASLRVVVFESGVRAEPSVMVTLRAPGGMPEAPQALHAVEYQRTASASSLEMARGIAPVGRIDDVQLPGNRDVMTVLQRLYAEVPWDAF